MKKVLLVSPDFDPSETRLTSLSANLTSLRFLTAKSPLAPLALAAVAALTPDDVEVDIWDERDGFVSSMGWLTAFVSDSTMALVEDGTLLRPRQFDMGNSG